MSYNNDENPDLLKKVEGDTELKKWLVSYVGEKTEPENGEVNVEMIIKTIAAEFPEFLLAVAAGGLGGSRQYLNQTGIQGTYSLWKAGICAGTPLV